MTNYARADFHHLATLITELDLKPVIISESPILDVDAQKMRDMVLRALEGKRRLWHDA